MKDDKFISGYDDIRPQSTEEGYARLEDLIAGVPPKKQLRNNRIQIVIYILLVVFMIGLYIKYTKAYPSSYYRYWGNPITKILLKVDAKNYIEENYPDLAEDMDVDINNGIIFHTNGYMVICRDVNNRYSTVTIYYDKSRQALYDVPQLKE